MPARAPLPKRPTTAAVSAPAAHADPHSLALRHDAALAALGARDRALESLSQAAAASAETLATLEQRLKEARRENSALETRCEAAERARAVLAERCAEAENEQRRHLATENECSLLLARLNASTQAREQAESFASLAREEASAATARADARLEEAQRLATAAAASSGASQATVAAAEERAVRAEAAAAAAAEAASRERTAAGEAAAAERAAAAEAHRALSLELDASRARGSDLENELGEARREIAKLRAEADAATSRSLEEGVVAASTAMELEQARRHIEFDTKTLEKLETALVWRCRRAQRDKQEMLRVLRASVPLDRSTEERTLFAAFSFWRALSKRSVTATAAQPPRPPPPSARARALLSVMTQPEAPVDAVAVAAAPVRSLDEEDRMLEELRLEVQALLARV